MIIIINLISSLCCIFIFSKFVLMPMYAKTFLDDEFKTLMFQCDNVMRDHLIAKNKVLYEKSDSAIANLKSSEIGLLSCHEYDKLRKKMISYGLTPNDLALIGIQAIEDNSKDIFDFVTIHEFKY